MLEAVHTDLVFTISLKRSTQNLQLSTSWPADYAIFVGDAEVLERDRDKLAQYGASARVPFHLVSGSVAH
jgi:hypothetical protein